MAKKVVLNNKHENNVAKQKAIELFKITAAHRVSEKEYKEKRQSLMKDISNFLFVNGIKAFIAKGSDGRNQPVAYRVKKVYKNRVVYDAEKVENAVGKKLASEIIEKEYTVNDMVGLTAYLKECGVDPKVFKDFIDVSKTVNTAKLEQAYQLGKVEMKDLRGCYDVELISSYIDVKEVDEQEPYENED